jgi:modification methylase
MTKNSKTSHFGSSSRISHDSSEYYGARLNTGLPTGVTVEPQAENAFPDTLKNCIVEGSSESMEAIPDNSVHLMITSPPYNVTKDYDRDMSLQEYLGMLDRVFRETYRVLVDGGRVCVNVANLGRKPYIPLSHHLSSLMAAAGYRMRGEIIWNKGAGAGVSMAWGSFQSASNPVIRDVHEYILVYSKGSLKREKNGRNSTITRMQFMEWTKSIWTINPESARKIGHPAPFPVELPYRLIQLFSFEGDVVLDPFMGSGTTALAAVKGGRSYVGYETNPDYIALANERLKAIGEGRDRDA